MNCESARELLSAYFDQELAPEAAAEVSAHLSCCDGCTHHLIEFEELSALAGDLRQPEVPPGVWSAIEPSLPTGQRQAHQGPMTSWRRTPIRAAIAATPVLCASFARAAWVGRALHPHVQMTAVFNQYLGELQTHPEQAHEVLRIKYDGRPLDSGAVRPGQFTPNAPQALPHGFTRLGTYVLDMPCCTCTQTIYKNTAGDVLALFEHSENQRMWFGDRPVIEATCDGQATFLVQLNDRLAASWKCGPRHLTVIGAKNIEQVADFVTFLDEQRSSPPG